MIRPCAQCSTPFDTSRFGRKRYCTQDCFDASRLKKYFERRGEEERPLRATQPGRMKWERVALYLGSRPTPTREALDPANLRQRTACRRRFNCMEHACGEDWDGFSCTACPIQEPLTPEQLRADLVGLSRLLRGMDITTPFDQWKRRLCASRR
jgi:hypothetical protein